MIFSFRYFAIQIRVIITSFTNIWQTCTIVRDGNWWKFVLFFVFIFNRLVFAYAFLFGTKVYCVKSMNVDLTSHNGNERFSNCFWELNEWRRYFHWIIFYLFWKGISLCNQYIGTWPLCKFDLCDRRNFLFLKIELKSSSQSYYHRKENLPKQVLRICAYDHRNQSSIYNYISIIK